MMHILNTLHADNPWFANIRLKEEPGGYGESFELLDISLGAG
jgi:hypothetical protein